MSNENEVYEKIAAMWRLPGSKRLIRILKNGFTPEEGEIMLGLSNFTTCADLAKKLNKDEKYVQEKLDSLSRGWIRGLHGKYATVTNTIAIIPHSTMPGVPEEERRAQWLDWFRTDEYQQWQLESWVRMRNITGHAIHRILPVHRALAASPKIKPEQILWYEDMPEVFKRTKKIFVGPCGCRSVWGVCDHPMVTCIGVTYTDPVPGPANDRRPKRKEITPDEAMAIIEKCEDEGMLNIPPNNAMAQMFCNCCSCCCEIVYPYNHNGDPVTNEANLSPSRFRATADRESCSGCQTCVERCPFGAIEMRKMPNSKKLKATIVNEKCQGCGLCVIKCPTNALTLELIRPPEHIPVGGSMEETAKKIEAFPNWLNPEYVG
jgi:Na+-translocating ferredoxin:NAD+ oxidoreductase subunit B